MSSLKDIIDDVDVEPLQYQAHIRSHRQRAAQDIPPPISYSPSQSPTRDTKGKKSARHRRSHRSPKYNAQSSETSSRQGRDSDSAEGMDHRPRAYRQPSASSSNRQSSRDGMEMGVKLTPVTRRVSRAKKGERVHNCDTCQKTFTRAEHLRRHQQSHEKAGFPCTFEDCERAFHRKDLLDRHMNRHETQGEKAYKSPNQRSRSLSSSPEPGHGASLNTSMTSSYQTTRGTERNSTDIAPRPAGVGELQPGAAPYGNFQYAMDINRSYSNHDMPHELSMPTVTNAPRTPTLTTMNPHFPYGNISPRQPSVYSGSAYTTIAPGATTYQLGIQIPEQYPNNLLGYDGSPWYSSDSTSTPSDASRPRGGDFSYRGRSASIGSVSDWGYNGIPYSPRLGSLNNGMNPNTSGYGHGQMNTHSDGFAPELDSALLGMDYNVDSLVIPEEYPMLTLPGEDAERHWWSS